MFNKSKKPRDTSSSSTVEPVNDAQAILDAFGRSQAIIEFTPNGEIISANDNFLQTLGYTLDEIRGKHHRLFVDPKEAASEAYKTFWRKLADGHLAAGEFERVDKHGHAVWISASYNPVVDDTGKVTKIVKIASDITATKQKSIEQLALLDALSRSQAIIEFEPDGTILTANDNFLHTVGYTLDEIRGKHHSMFCDPEYASTPEYKNFWVQLQSGQHFAERFRRIAKDGRDIWIQASYNPVFDRDGRPFKVVKLATDITSEMTQELQNKQEASNIGQMIASSTTQMAATIQEISKSVSRTATLADESERATHGSVEAIKQLEESSKEIGKVVNVIQDLADQTNLLALNATIEAARAGENGRGFAVVANEVKALAQGTSNATENIEKNVNEIQSRVNEFSASTEHIGRGVAEVSDHTKSVAAAIEEQSVTMANLSKTADTLVGLT